MKKIFLVPEDLGTNFNITRVKNDYDIPQILWNYVAVIQDNIYLTFSKKHIVCPLGSLIAWSTQDSTISDCRYIEKGAVNWVEKNGYFYETTIIEAQKIDDNTYQLSQEGVSETTILRKSDLAYQSYLVCKNGKVIDYLYKLDPVS